MLPSSLNCEFHDMDLKAVDCIQQSPYWNLEPPIMVATRSALESKLVITSIEGMLIDEMFSADGNYLVTRQLNK